MKPYQALIWNEWRQMRGNVMALAGVTALLWLLLLLGSFNKMLVEYIEMIATALAVGLPLLYSIVLADSFAREFGQKTDSFLLELPASPSKIFFCKYCTNLMIFLALSTVSALIMLPIIMSRTISLALSRYFIYDIPFYVQTLWFSLIILLWLLFHGMVFLTSLLGRKPGNGIAAIITIPLIWMLMLPGTMSATMFFVNDDRAWGISCLLIPLIILFFFCVGFGWYLWTCRIARGRKTLKPVIAALAAMLITSSILYGMAYFVANMSFNAAIREAGAAGIETDIRKLVLPPVPVEQNAAAGIIKFNNEYKPIARLYSDKNEKYGKKRPGPLPSHCNYSGPLWTGTDFYSGKRPRETLPRQTIFEIADFIMNDPCMNQCYIILAEALKKPYCRFSTSDNAEFLRANMAVNFLADRAYALRATGRDDDFFACLAGIDKVADALAEQPFLTTRIWGLRCKIIECQTAIAAGPDTAGSVKFYNETIRDIDSINPALPLETFRIYDYLENFNSLSKADKLDSFLLKCNFHLPRLLQSAAAWVRWKIQEDKLFKQMSASTNYRAIESAVNSLQKDLREIPGFFKSMAFPGIWQYFYYRAQFESCKLCLALKIYHIKYGRFPDSLQRLVPEILSEIPVDPQTGRDYRYQPETNGFCLSGSYSIKYQTWDIKPEGAK
ncbi:MAG: hypothetical protein WCV67_09645 [Victivallaceae bacterium]